MMKIIVGLVLTGKMLLVMVLFYIMFGRGLINRNTGSIPPFATTASVTRPAHPNVGQAAPAAINSATCAATPSASASRS